MTSERPVEGSATRQWQGVAEPDGADPDRDPGLGWRVAGFSGEKKNLCIQLERILIAAELIRSAAGRGKHEEGGKRGLNGSNFKSQPVQ